MIVERQGRIAEVNVIKNNLIGYSDKTFPGVKSAMLRACEIKDKQKLTFQKNN